MPNKKRGYRILVIEDNPGDFALVEDFLLEQFESPVITHTENFKDAKKALLENTTFDSVLLDLSLPDKQGEALIFEIVEVSLSTPVIVLTGYADFEFGIKSLSLGISDYILKEELTSISLYKSIIYSSERKKGIAALEEQNEKLKEIAWMQSHVVRAPVARIMGLIQMITDFKQDAIEQEKILGYIMLSANELDVIIRDISAKTDTVSY